MKWYKKQLDQLKKSNEKPEVEKAKISKRKSHSFDIKKTGANKVAFPNPVSARNRNRPKTDSIG